MGIVSERWSQTYKNKALANSDTGVRIFDVVGATSFDDARTSVGVVINDLYPGDTLMRCSNVNPLRIAPGIYVVTAQFSIPPLGTFRPSVSPLSEAATIQWQTSIATEPFDRDVNGRPIVDPNRVAFAQPPTRDYVSKVFRLTKNQAFYDYQSLKAYENTVNNADVTATEPNGNVVTWEAGSLKCVCIEPAAAYRSNDTFVPVTATIHALTRTDGITTSDPHQLRILCQGSHGFYTSNGSAKLGIFCTDQGGPLASDTLLKSDGTPWDSTIKVWDGRIVYTPVANPTPVTWCTFETNSTNRCTYAIFQRYSKTDFTALFATLNI